MLAIADTMPSDTGLASPLLAFDQHGRCGCECVFLFSLSVMVTRKGVIFRPFHILGVLALGENGKVGGLPWKQRHVEQPNGRYAQDAINRIAASKDRNSWWRPLTEYIFG